MSQHTGRDGGRISKKDRNKAVVVLLLAVGFMAIALLLIHRWEDRRYEKQTSADAAEGNGSGADSETGRITIEGVSYQPKEHIRTYLFMGIDVQGPAKPVESYIGGGQADVQIVLVVDEEAETWQLLQLNRDSIVEVTVLGMTGQIIGTETQQLALAHAYGRGMKDSCMNTVSVVSALLGGQEIDGYLSLHMDGAAIVNDAIGGVTVTVTSDFTAVDDTLIQGETITLQGEQALTFIRSRKNVEDQTNLSRMARQRQYLAALFERLSEVDEETILEAYQAAEDYIVTDLGSQTMVDLAEQMKQYTQLELLTIEGTSYLDEEGANAWQLDEDSLQETILQLFYERAE